jgi:outer membrane protein assembly factor BamD
MSYRKCVIAFLLITAMVFPACNNYQKVLKGSDYDLKYQKALELYKKKDYTRAFPLLEELVSVKRGTAAAEDIYYYYCYCHYYLDDLVSSSYHFQQFAKTYPNSSKAEEAAYMVAYCYYLGSPEYSLDQTNSLKAIEEMQVFINQYPTSEYVAKCNELIDQLRIKLELKSVETSLLYFKTMDYKAAIIALKNSLKDFPNTKYREQILFTILKSNYLLAENSVDSKKSERYKNTMDAYYAFIDKFANGKDAREAEQIFEKARASYSLYKPVN